MVKTFFIASSISRIGKESLNETLKKYSIGTIEYYILYYLEKSPGSTQYNLLKYTMQTKSRVNQIVTKLEKMGYVNKKVEIVGSLLKKPIYNTDLGSRVVEAGIESMYSNIIENLTEEEREKYIKYNKEMKNILAKMVKELKVEVPEFF
jgi:DNA-binding MarR family transcriptional regulator